MTPYIPVVTRKYNLRISVEEVIYLKQQSRRLRIATGKDEYTCYRRMEDFLPLLDRRFCSVMQSIIINLDKVIRMEDQTIFFENGQLLTLGRCNYIKAKQYYAAWLKKLR